MESCLPETHTTSSDIFIIVISFNIFGRWLKHFYIQFKFDSFLSYDIVVGIILHNFKNSIFCWGSFFFLRFSYYELCLVTVVYLLWFICSFCKCIVSLLSIYKFEYYLWYLLSLFNILSDYAISWIVIKEQYIKQNPTPTDITDH